MRAAERRRRLTLARWPLRPLHWLKLFFATPVHLQRRGKELHVVFDDTSPPAPSAAPAAGAPPEKDAALRAMRKALHDLLEQHRHVRRVMRHLRHFESALKRSGMRAFDDLPVDVQKTALAQLQSLVSDWSPAGLAELRSRLSVSVMAKEPDTPYEPTGSKLSDFCTSERLQVQEITHSDFENLARVAKAGDH
ncbi:MAG TPA: hypothetical protein VJ608_12965 [Albitalea sp.]|nr:hypothetical protein [Albitalea sp.]